MSGRSARRPAEALGPTDVTFAFAGTNTAPVTPIIGVNTLLLSGTLNPTPDIVAVAATLGGESSSVPPTSRSGYRRRCDPDRSLHEAVLIARDERVEGTHQEHGCGVRASATAVISRCARGEREGRYT
jgi:hypothetical protein